MSDRRHSCNRRMTLGRESAGSATTSSTQSNRSVSTRMSTIRQLFVELILFESPLTQLAGLLI